MEWKAEYGLILFLAFAGVTYRLTQGKDEGNTSILVRIYAQFYAWLFTSVTCIGLLLLVWQWNLVFVCMATLLLSPVSERFIYLWMKGQNSSSNVFQFIKRFRKTWDAIDDNNSTTNENHEDS